MTKSLIVHLSKAYLSQEKTTLGLRYHLYGQFRKGSTVTCSAEAYRDLCPSAVGDGGLSYHIEFEITLIRQGAVYTPLSPGREGWRGLPSVRLSVCMLMEL